MDHRRRYERVMIADGTDKQSASFTTKRNGGEEGKKLLTRGSLLETVHVQFFSDGTTFKNFYRPSVRVNFFSRC